MTRIALVTASAVEGGVGGGALRWRSLAHAISRIGESVMIAVDELDVPVGAAVRHHRWPDDGFGPEAGNALVRTVAGLRPDVVVVTELRLHDFARALVADGRWRVVLDLHNAEYARALELAYAVRPGGPWADYYTLERAEHVREVERAVVAAVDEVWVCTDLDAAVLRAHYPAESRGKLRVVPNGIDVPAVVDRPAPPTRLVFTGVLDYLPNAQAIEFLVRRVAPELPGVEIVVAGTGRPPLPLPTAPNVRYHGPFEHVAEVMTDGVMVVPLTSGGGSRFKILEAFAARVPVVSTAKGSEGLDVRDGVHLILAEERDEFVAAIDVFRRDTALRNTITAQALDLVRRDHSLDAVHRRVAEALRHQP